MLASNHLSLDKVATLRSWQLLLLFGIPSSPYPNAACVDPLQTHIHCFCLELTLH